MIGTAGLLAVAIFAIIAIFISFTDEEAIATAGRLIVAFFEARIDKTIAAERFDAATVQADARIVFVDAGT